LAKPPSGREFLFFYFLFFWSTNSSRPNLKSCWQATLVGEKVFLFFFFSSTNSRPNLTKLCTRFGFEPRTLWKVSEGPSMGYTSEPKYPLGVRGGCWIKFDLHWERQEWYQFWNIRPAGGILT
jgi:hypothetical protein